MREIIKKSLSFFVAFLLLLLTSCEGFNGINFNENIKEKINEDLAVTYHFYEYPDLNSSHIDRVFMISKTVSSSSFPKFVQDENILVGWQYMKEGQTTDVQLPKNFTLNAKNYINTVRVGYEEESLYAIWKKKCTVTFVTNMDGLTIDPVIVPEGDTLEYPQFNNRQGELRFWGWYTDEEFHQGWDFNKPVTGDMTLYGKWVHVFTITYHKNDGTDNKWEREYPIEENYSHDYADCMFGQREGYGFVGWSSTASGAVEFYSGDEISGTQNRDLYAVWSDDVITISYIDKSSNFDSKSLVYGRGAHITVGRVLNDDNRWYQDLGSIWKIDGKEIAGFSTDTNADIENLPYDKWGGYDSDPSPDHYVWKNYIAVTENLTFYTFWRDIVYTVTFRYQDRFGNLQNFGQSVTVGWNQCLTRPATDPMVPGKTFENWYYATPVNNGYAISTSPFDFSTKFNDDSFNGNRYITMMAKFTEGGVSTGDVTSGISFAESPDSDISFSSISINRSANTIQLSAPTGYSEYHWYINGAEDTNLTNQNTVSITTTSWTAGYYDITLIVYDGTNYYSCQGTLTKN